MANKWKPIDTAPKDGRVVLFYCAGNGWISTGCWGGSFFFAHTLGPQVTSEIRDNTPTHWMPLPEGPK